MSSLLKSRIVPDNHVQMQDIQMKFGKILGVDRFSEQAQAMKSRSSR